MKHERVDETEASDGSEDAKPTFNVTIVYDDYIAGIRAMDVFSGLVREFSDEFEFHCGLWRFDVLALPEVFEAAVEAGAAADLIIVSAHCGRELPAAVKDWLEQCVAVKAPGSAALVGLLESRQSSGDIPCRTRRFMQKIADGRVLDLFLREMGMSESGLGLTSERLQARANTISPLLQQILRQAEPTQRPRA